MGAVLLVLARPAGPPPNPPPRRDAASGSPLPDPKSAAGSGRPLAAMPGGLLPAPPFPAAADPPGPCPEGRDALDGPRSLARIEPDTEPCGRLLLPPPAREALRGWRRGRVRWGAGNMVCMPSASILTLVRSLQAPHPPSHVHVAIIVIKVWRGQAGLHRLGCT